ncbi:putative quinol monooxygenase [Cupriavidus basilensis]|uniref:putative quinol monooxygenase n=1 Tax=Cupriavidus basilensis TaxID=68895 RepID=UPI00157AA4B5|nr:putative quinol monooxygenase [Cupriavidus basilensis]NUA30616.1 antibiotic biosynthesis monooxygenase [Cupriavidus basilensis]
MRAIVAKIKVKEGQEANFEALAAGLVAESRREAGCLSYDLWRSDEAREYVFIERYTDDAAVQAHVKSDHYRRIGHRMGALMDGAPTAYRLSAAEVAGDMASDNPESAADGRLDAERVRLLAHWLRHFGVDDASELDLGTLEVIRQCINDGVPPPDRTAHV